jgi:translation elongation factor P/translation initiation factor 5A
MEESACNLSTAESKSVKKGDHVMLDSRPCKIVNVAHAKTGKHGAIKVNLTGVDVLLVSKKYQWTGPGHLRLNTFKPVKKQYAVVMLEGDRLTCLNEKNEEKLLQLSREDSSSPSSSVTTLQRALAAGKDLVAAVLFAPVEVSDGVFEDQSVVEGFKEGEEA